jgi:hypothetical protein
VNDGTWMQADNERGVIKRENVGKECDLDKLDVDFLLQN